MPSVKFFTNLFFLKNSPSLCFQHTNYPHFFITSKTLKIKLLKTSIINLYWKIMFTIAAFCLIIGLVCVVI